MTRLSQSASRHGLNRVAPSAEPQNAAIAQVIVFRLLALVRVAQAEKARFKQLLQFV
jgi:hypothetical protein